MHAAIVDAFAVVPDVALAWLKSGDGYAIGGIFIHLVGRSTATSGHSAPARRQAIATPKRLKGKAAVDAHLAHGRHGRSVGERTAAFAEMRSKHQSLSQLARNATQAQFDALAGVTYPRDDAPYPTGAALVVQRVTDHDAEHVPHVQALFAEWRKAR